MNSSASSPTETILVVDDDLEVLSVTEDMLRSMRYSVTSTMDPRVALRFARTHPRRYPSPPDGRGHAADGRRPAAAEFHAIRPDAKVLFMSAYSVESVDAYSVRRAPGEPFLKKPFTMDELQKTLRAAALAYRPARGSG
jgi:CheY-like chemotaxis protein